MIAEPITLAPSPDERADIGPEPYELLIDEAMQGDPTLFAREDSIEESWRIVEPILTHHADVELYEPGTWGPPGARRPVATHVADPAAGAGRPARDPGRRAGPRHRCRRGAQPRRAHRPRPVQQ